MPSLFDVSYMSLWVLVIIQGILLLLIYRHFGILALGSLEGVQRDGLTVGEAALPISGVTAAGQDLVWKALPGKSYLILFAAPGCQPCEQVIPAVNQLGAFANGYLDGLIVVPGRQDAAVDLVNKFRPPFPCIAEDGSSAFNNYKVRATPFAFVIGEDGHVRAKGLCNDAMRLQELLVAAGLTRIEPLVDPSRFLNPIVPQKIK